MKDKIITAHYARFDSEQIHEVKWCYLQNTYTYLNLTLTKWFSNTSFTFLCPMISQKHQQMKSSDHKVPFMWSKSNVSRDTSWFGKKDKHMGAMSCDQDRNKVMTSLNIELFDDYVKKERRFASHDVQNSVERSKSQISFWRITRAKTETLPILFVMFESIRSSVTDISRVFGGKKIPTALKFALEQIWEEIDEHRQELDSFSNSNTSLCSVEKFSVSFCRVADVAQIDGWVQVVWGSRPPSVRWPKTEHSLRPFSSVDTSVHSAPQSGPIPSTEQDPQSQGCTGSAGPRGRQGPGEVAGILEARERRRRDEVSSKRSIESRHSHEHSRDQGGPLREGVGGVRRLRRSQARRVEARTLSGQSDIAGVVHHHLDLEMQVVQRAQRGTSWLNGGRASGRDGVADRRSCTVVPSGEGTNCVQRESNDPR